MTRITSKNIEKILTQRLADATYADGLLPSERDLAGEFGVARPTVRKALTSLVNAGKLTRLESGRLQGAAGNRGKLRIGYFFPKLSSSDFDAHYMALERVADELSMRIQPIYYASWHDPALSEGCENMDAVILIPRPMMPEWMLRKLKLLNKPVLILEWDLSASGLPSFSFFPRSATRKLLDYLISLGYQDIDLLNISPSNPVHRERIEVWRDTLAEIGGNGRIWDFGLVDGNLPYRELREIFRQRIQSGVFALDRVLLCTTMAAAMIFARAAADCGLTAGRDYSLAVIDGELQAEFHTPAITALERMDAYGYFKAYLEWMRSGTEWSGSMFGEASEVILQKGESIVIRSIDRG